MSTERSREVQKYKNRQNAETRQTASHHRQPWTDEEVALAADPSLTRSEVARRTGRTVFAVDDMRHQLRHGTRTESNYTPNVATPSTPPRRPTEVCDKCYMTRPCEHDDGLR